MKDCKDCQHREWSRNYMADVCKHPEITTGRWISIRCSVVRKPEWPCGPDAKYFKSKGDV